MSIGILINKIPKKYQSINISQDKFNSGVVYSIDCHRGCKIKITNNCNKCDFNFYNYFLIDSSQKFVYEYWKNRKYYSDLNSKIKLQDTIFKLNDSIIIIVKEGEKMYYKKK